MLKVYSLEEKEQWDAVAKSFCDHDIYYLNGYAQACWVHGEGEPLLFYYNGNGLRGLHVVILRDVSKSSALRGKLPEGQYFDLSTPYGYGGWLLEGEGDQNALFGAYGAWCREHNVVSEFVRFHPVRNNAPAVLRDVYHPIPIRKTLGSDLAAYNDPVQHEFSPRCRKNIRQALRKGITYRVTYAPEEIEAFRKVYYSTMDRDNAEQFYYFTQDYFDTLLQQLREHVLYVEAVYEEQTIAAGLYLVTNGLIQIHLSGTLQEYLYLSPAYLLRYAAALWGKEHGCTMIHHGGGLSNAADDSLYRFKKQFGQNTEFDFYIGKKIWDRQGYDRLCALVRIELGGDFFPAYRRQR